MANKKTHIFTDCDLDGVCSYLVYSWMIDSKCTYTVCRVNDIKRNVLQWLDSNNPDNYEKIVFLDLDVSSHDIMDLIDRENVYIYDHHITHVNNVKNYKHANVYVEEYTSTCKLLYKYNKDLKDKLTPAQKLLILMGDDYDSYQFKVPNSYELNVLFWSLTGARFDKFVEMFDEGFTGFDDQQSNIIQLWKNKLDRIKSNLEVYHANVPIKNDNYKIVTAFATECINDIADYIIKKHTADVGLVVNTKSSKVSFRKNKNCKLDLSKFSQSVCDSAGGHTFASGGMLCDKFLQFSQIFKPI